MLDGSSQSARENPRFWRMLFAVLVFALTALRVTYLGTICPLDLCQDEAHYWDWSRNLDWSYYSKGPLVAWLIRLGIELFGPLSVSLTGNEMMAVRLPAVACGSLLLVALYILSLQTVHSDRHAFFVVFFATTMPMIGAASILMTIDSPYICCWSWALVAGHRAFSRNEKWAWGLTGLLLGIGILAKFTMSLWLFSFTLFLRFSPGYRQLLFSSGFWVMTGLAFVCSVPIIGWNATHDWVSFRHVAGQAGVSMHRPAHFRVTAIFDYLGGQFLLLLGFWFIGWLCAMFHFRPARNSDTNIRYLWWMSLPTFLVFMASSLRTPGQANWPVAAYLAGSVLLTAWLLNAVQSRCTWFRRLAKTSIVLACASGLLVTIVGLDSRIARPLLVALGKALKPNDPYAVRTFDPTCRLRGWSQLGRDVDELRRDLRNREGREPVLAALYWNLPGEIGFYCEGHPKAYSLGPYIGERLNQYDLWRPNPVMDLPLFTNDTFLVVNGHRQSLQTLFAEAKLAKEVVHCDDGIPVSYWSIWICRGYRGIGHSLPLIRDGY